MIFLQFIPHNYEILKLSEKVKNKTHKLFLNSNEESCLVDLFDQIHDETFVNLEEMIFEKFLQSQLWQEFEEKNPDTVLDIKVNRKEKEILNFAVFPSKKKSTVFEFSKSPFLTNDGKKIESNSNFFRSFEFL